MNNCIICKKAFHQEELLQSSQDDFYCKECFKYQYWAARPKKKKSPMRRKCEGDTMDQCKKMFTGDEIATIKMNRGRMRITMPSKRPLQCPHDECNRYVRIYDLLAHFQHEHIQIPILSTALDSRNPLTFFPKDLRYGLKQCLVLLIVPPTPIAVSNNATSGSQLEKEAPPIAIVVLAARVASAQLGEENDLIEENEDTEDSHTSALFGNSDKIIIWTASNIVCDLSYTVAVSTVSEDIRVKYYGPVLQLGNSPVELCMEGQCLILSHFHLLGMSENGTKPLHLDVIIHSED